MHLQQTISRRAPLNNSCLMSNTLPCLALSLQRAQRFIAQAVLDVKEKTGAHKVCLFKSHTPFCEAHLSKTPHILAHNLIHFITRSSEIPLTRVVLTACTFSVLFFSASPFIYHHNSYWPLTCSLEWVVANCYWRVYLLCPPRVRLEVTRREYQRPRGQETQLVIY